MEDRPARGRNRSGADLRDVKPLLGIPRPVHAIAGKSIIPEILSSAFFRAVRQGTSYFTFPILDTYSRLCSILRSSSFRVHLKKHGLKPDDYMEFSTRSQSPVEVPRPIEPEGITGGQDSSHYGSSFNQEAPLPGPSSSWDSLFSSVDPCKSTTGLLVIRELTTSPVAAMPLVMLPEYTPEVSCNSPLLLASSSQFPLDYNHGYFLSPSSLGASSAASSRYSSPVASTQVMTPEMESGFVSDVSLRCSVPQQDWTGNDYWQAYGIPFVG